VRRGFRWSPAHVRSHSPRPSVGCRSHPGPGALAKRLVVIQYVLLDIRYLCCPTPSLGVSTGGAAGFKRIPFVAQPMFNKLRIQTGGFPLPRRLLGRLCLAVAMTA